MGIQYGHTCATYIFQKMWKDLQVVPEVTGPLVTLSSECIENEEMTSDKLVSELKVKSLLN
jgi:hypothetical protein